ncbi:TetR family transcriptional regulator [Sinobacterium caligoides]|uniref:TetR family transcriptional regulator n=1 Tax=Sinobacterium caligoides TaxID=933926 RepID=A0A3N2DQ73_9GAMM|nr:TetR/AcrR family transcriptional regulator [Sinobacterium caligoides]ROS01832.1 TetR family transcriptional regulator [Sinobacterium caligoides]
MASAQPPSTVRRSQAQRRAETRAKVLRSACLLFGRQGYHQTSLEDIAQHGGVTIRPIYHYFGNKLKLFAAVTEQTESRILTALDSIDPRASIPPLDQGLSRFLELCLDPAFRQIVLLDSPSVLGRQRWSSSAVTLRAQQQIAILLDQQQPPISRGQGLLIGRLLIANFAEIALFIAEADDFETAKNEAEALLRRSFNALLSSPQ